MEKILKLYYGNGNPFPSAEEQIILTSFSYTAPRMGVPGISANVSHRLCLDDLWGNDVYTEFNGEKYFVKSTPSSSKSNADTRYVHDLEFRSERDILNYIYFIDAVQDNSEEDIYKSNSTKVLFIGDLNQFVSRLNSSLTQSGVGYTAVIDNDINTEEEEVSFENRYIMQSLQDAYDIFKVPYYFVGKVIHFGYTTNTIPYVLKYGDKDALLSISKENGNYQIINRITGTGSSDNIPYYYPNDTDDQSAVESSGKKWIAPTQNLMPPIYRDSEGAERFYDAKNNTYQDHDNGGYYSFENEYSKENPREGITTFEDIKPTITGVTNASGERIDSFLAFGYDYSDSDAVDPDTGEYLHPYFFAKLKKTNGNYGFNLFDQAIESQSMQITFTSGVCGACKFEIAVGEESQKNLVQVNDKGELKRDDKGNVLCGREDLQQPQEPQDRQNDTRNNEVWIALRKDVNTFPQIMPNVSYKYKPSTNDTFAILGISLPKAYILKAEQELEDSLIRYMWENNTEKFTFSCKLSRVYFEENPYVLDTLNENSRVIIEYNGIQHVLYVEEYSYKMEENEPLPEIEITLADTLSVGSGSLDNVLNLVKQNILSNLDFLRLGLKYFLRKDSPDQTNHNINFYGGAKFRRNVLFGNMGYARGIAGFGGMIDGDANAELESLTLRRFLEVPELRYNRVDISVGDKWRAPGLGIIESVAIDTREEIINGETVISELTSGTITLHLEEGEIGAVAVDDICMGIFHDWKTPGNNATEDTDDSRGNRTFAGFATVYFRITEILDEENKTFKYALRGTSANWQKQFHPCEAMHFVSYGNFTNKERQTSVYETRTYTRMLVKQDTWEIGADNIAMQWGDLSNLKVFGKQMEGYSAYLNNIYMSGTIEQGVATPYRMELETSSDQFLGLGESLAVSAKVYHGWEDITDSVGENFTISRESSDSASDAQWAQGSKAQSFKSTGKITLSYSSSGSDMGTDFEQNGTLFTFGANLTDGGSVSAQILVRPLPKGTPGASGQDGQDAVRRWLVVSPEVVNKDNLGNLGATVTITKMEQTGTGEPRKSDYGYIVSRFLRNSGQSSSPWSSYSESTVNLLLTKTNSEIEIRFCENSDPESTLIDSKNVTVVSNGEPGQDATSYWIAADPEMIVFAESGGLTQNKSCTFTAWSQTGTEAPAVFTGGRLTYATSDNPSETEADTATGSFGVMFRLADGIPQRTWAIARLYVGDTVVASKTVNLDQGIDGCIVRTSEWVEGVQYRNDTQYLFTDWGQKYLDVAVITKSATEFEAYQCKATHTATDDTKPGSGAGWQSYWVKFNMMAPIYTPLIMAQYGVIRFMQSNRLFVMQSDGLTVAAAFAGGDWPLWVGAQKPEDAPFKVSIDGKLFATGAEITGDSTFSGTLEGVTGSFKELTAVGLDLPKISFTNDSTPKLWFQGDIWHQGTVNDRTSRFYSGDIWCRGYFGAKQRLVVQLMNSGSQMRARYITEWNNTGATKYVDILIDAKWSLGVDYYTIPCYCGNNFGVGAPTYDFGDVAGMPVDIVLLSFPHQGGVMDFNIVLDMWPTQRVFVANVPSNSYPIYLYVNGKPVSIDSRTVREVVCFPPNMISSSLTSTTLGAGQLVGAVGTTEI